MKPSLKLIHPAPRPEPASFPGTIKHRIIQLCAEHGVSYRDIIGKSRNRELVAKRHVIIGAIYTERHVDGKPPSKSFLGKHFGDRDHSSIRNSLVNVGLMPPKPNSGIKRQPSSGISNIREADGRYIVRLYRRRKTHHGGSFKTLHQAKDALMNLKRSLGEA